MSAKSALPSLSLPAIAELAQLRQWVLYKLVDGGRPKPTKVPYQPGGAKASTTNPATWSSFERVAHAFVGGFGDGVGFVFNGDGVVGVDLDGCVGADGTLAPWAERIVAPLASYTEKSPSGTGLHVIVRGALPPGRRKKGAIEVYDRARFFTMTGEHWPGTPETVEERSEALAAFHAEHLGGEPQRGAGREVGPLALDPRAEPPAEKLALLCINHDGFARLWGGTYGLDLMKATGPEAGRPDGNRIDFRLARIALCAHWTPEEVASLIVAARRARGDLARVLRHRTYLQRTIANASRGID